MKKLIVVGVVGVAALAAAVALNRWYDDDTPDAPALGVSAPRPPSVQERPVIGVARVNQNGDVMISGRAVPGSEVTVLDGVDVVGQVKANEHGDWVFVPKDALRPGTREIAVEAKLPDGRIVRSAAPVRLEIPVKAE